MVQKRRCCRRVAGGVILKESELASTATVSEVRMQVCVLYTDALTFILLWGHETVKMRQPPRVHIYTHTHTHTHAQVFSSHTCECAHVSSIANKRNANCSRANAVIFTHQQCAHARRRSPPRPPPHTSRTCPPNQTPHAADHRLQLDSSSLMLSMWQAATRCRSCRGTSSECFLFSTRLVSPCGLLLQGRGCHVRNEA